MGRPMSKDVTEIIAAGAALEAAGKPVNGTALRRALGGEGRPDALMRVWDAHKQAQTARPAALGPLIEQALSVLRLPLEQLAEASWSGASDGLAARTRELEAQLRETEEELKATIDRLECLREETTSQIAGLEVALSAARSQHNVEQHKLQDKVRTLEERLATRDDERQTVQALTDLMLTLQQAIVVRSEAPSEMNNAESTRLKRGHTNKQTNPVPLLDAIAASRTPQSATTSS